jgi:hypothetical protein
MHRRAMLKLMGLAAATGFASTFETNLSRSGKPTPETAQDLDHLADRYQVLYHSTARPGQSMRGVRPAPCLFGHVVRAGPLGVVSCSSFAPMSARRIALVIFPTWVRGSASMSSRRSGHLYLASPSASR